MLLESGLEVRREGVVTQMLIEKWFPGAVFGMVYLVSITLCCELCFM